MKHKTLKTWSAVTLLIVVVAGVIICTLLFDCAEKTILNSTPYPCVVAVKYQSSPNNWQTIGWFKLGPGERKTLKATFFRVKPEFFVAAESRDPGLISWLTEGGDGVVYFHGNDMSGEVPKNRDLNPSEVKEKNGELEEIGFVRASATEEIHVLTDPLFQDAVLRNDGAQIGNEEDGFQLIKEKATQLYESLYRQKRFEETFKSESDYPFLFEFNMTDDSEQGFMYLGVTLSDVLPQTLHGDEIQLRNADVLIGVGSGEKPVTPVFATADAYMALHEHALDTENGGIAKPLRFIVMRDKQLLQVESYYLFNPDFHWDDVSTVRAFFEPGVNSLTGGLWPWLVGAVSADPDAKWKTNQRLARLKQFHPKATAAGEIAGLLVPTPTKILNIGKVAWGGRLLGSTIVRGISVEILRVAVYQYNTSVPAPQSKESTAKDLSKVFAAPMPPKVVEGSYEEGIEPVFKERKSFGLTH